MGAVEEEEPRQPVGHVAREALGYAGPDVMRHDADAIEFERIEDRADIGRMHVGADIGRGAGQLLAIAEAPQIGRHAVVAQRREPLHDGRPRPPEFGPTVKEQQGATWF